MRTANRMSYPTSLSAVARGGVVALALLLPAAIPAADGVKVDPRAHLGVMVEAYLRNATQKKSFFIRYGAGSQRGLAAAIRLSAEMLVSQLESRRRPRERAITR